MTGELAALTTALCWAIAARLFRQLGGAFTALGMNLYKGGMTVAILTLFCILFVPFSGLPADAYLWLIVSGVIGIGIGDTFFFLALRRLGDGQTILVAETLAPIFAALLAMVWIAEWLSWMQWLGMALVILSVDMVIRSRRRFSGELAPPSGYLFAGIAALCQAIGAVISRDILTAYSISAVEAANWRLAGGLLTVIILIAYRKEPWLPRGFRDPALWMKFTVATLLGTVLAMYLQMLSFANAKAGVVQTLIATSAIFSLAVAFFMGEKVHRRTLFWSLAALAGVGILLAA